MTTPTNKTFTVTLVVRVDSERNLRIGAELHAKGHDGLELTEWQEIRSDDGGIAADLTMLLDPGSLPGCEILESRVERLDA